MKIASQKPEISLKDYLSATRDSSIIEPTMQDLSEQLQRIHNSTPEYRIDHMNISNIGYDSEQARFCFCSFKPMKDKEQEVGEDKERFAKIFLGAFLSVETGSVSDYTVLSSKDIRENIEQIVSVLEYQGKPTDYFKQVFINRDLSEYYHEHKNRMELGEGRNKSGHAYQKSLPGISGETVTTENEKQAAFINAIFYPTILLVMTIVLSILYKCFEFINR